MHEDASLKDGNFVDAMVLEGLDTETEVYHEEFFGPVFNLYKAESF